MKLIYLPTIVLLGAVIGCSNQANMQANNQSTPSDNVRVFQAEDLTGSSKEFKTETGDTSVVSMNEPGWLSFDMDFGVAARYRVQVFAQAASDAQVWVEDYVDNTDGRTYNVTGSIPVTPTDEVAEFFIEGSPFNKGPHKMKFHVSNGSVSLDRVVFTPMVEHQITPESLTQKMDGDEWKLAWSDEFDGDEVDDAKWT